MAAIFVVSVVTFIVVWVCCKPLKNCTRKETMTVMEVTACKSGDEASSIPMNVGDNEAYWSGDEATLKTGENVAYKSGDEVSSMIGNPAYKTIVERRNNEAADWSGVEATLKTGHNVAYLSYL